MKRNNLFRAAALCLLFAVLAAAVLPTAAAAPVPATGTAEQTEAAVLRISTAEEFREFAENCRLDSYSMGLTVTLETDLDLGGTAMESIPIFCGVFEGGGHSISGISITGSGPALGLFRYLNGTAVIRDLTVQGEILPSGTEPATGGIAGENAGRIENCRFMGKVSGSTAVGGIAGVNTVTGILEGCRVTGSIKGSHFTGGIAGENAGVIRSCTNAAGINTTARQNTVALEDITLDALTDTESAGTVTDLGGIAGTSSGIIRSCTNNGNIGYRHMSYNVGGIAGSSTGYLADCTNYGRIQGRKEVGGIVGQLEPALRIQYSADALQILQQQLEDLAVEAEQTALAAEGSANSLRGQLDTLRQQANTAADTAGQLIPDIDPENPQLPDADSLLALQNALTGSLTQLGGTATGIVSSTRSSAASLLKRLESLNKQMEAIGSTLDNAGSLLGGSVTDVSDEDTDADVSAKITGCTNHSSVSADRNVGGIVGAVGPENDLDPEDDAMTDGSYSLNVTGEIRAVVLNCTNRAAVSCKYRNAGGIAGLQIMGLLRDCLSTGAIEAADADCAGGIAGSSTGSIRSCSARCTIAAKKQVGGIAGSGAAVTDCRAMTAFADTVQSTGGILGIRTEPLFAQEEPITGNLYTRTGAKDPGGIDGVSYAGKAQPLPLDAFLALEGLDEAFRHATVTFGFADGSTAQVKLTPGDPLRAEDIPALPRLTGYTAHWQGLDEADIGCILFDLHFDAVYTGYDAVVGSAARRGAKPLLLIQGDFDADAAVSITAGDAVPPLAEKEICIGMWGIALSDAAGLRTGRLLLPEDADAAALRLALLKNGEWVDTPFTADGSYIVFAMDTDTEGAALVQLPGFPWLQTAGAGAAALVLLIAVIVLCRRTRRKKKAAAPAAAK
ncbi:MAG: hypothetical protein IJ412_00640 [Oscillospiraceae bacterium]|nr:hypothetical protein [Oscillospiraceae bacterium]